MSCYHCCLVPKPNQHLIDKILRQGEELRNSMVKTIVQSEPCYSIRLRNNVNGARLINCDIEKIKAYLRGDAMNKEDENIALESLRSMSTVDLSKITDVVYSPSSKRTVFQHPKNCNDCMEKLSINDKVMNKLQNIDKLELEQHTFMPHHLKFVDSMKVFINCLILNEIGNKRVFDNLAVDKISNISQTYFIEYSIPEILVKNKTRSISSENTVRFCARKTYQRAINFKQSSVHDVINFDNFDQLNNLKLSFKVSSRGFRQKRPNILGYAFFDFGSFNVSKNLTTSQDLAIVLDEYNPLVIGKLKITIQLGCGRSYFGKEFIDAIFAYGGNTIRSDITEIHNVSARSSGQLKEVKNQVETQVSAPPICETENIESTETSNKEIKIITKQEYRNQIILFSFLYVSEVEFTREVLNPRINCQSFAQEANSSYNLIGIFKNPVFNFYQEIPIVYNDEFLLKLRENYMVVEFYEKLHSNKDIVIGLAKLSLNSFYFAYRNPVIVKYLGEKDNPVVSIDGWEPIYNILNDETVGRVQVLLALGTKEQIDRLITERGFNKDAVKFKTAYTTSPQKQLNSANSNNNRDQIVQFEQVPLLNLGTNINKNVGCRYSPPVKLKGPPVKSPKIVPKFPSTATITTQHKSNINSKYISSDKSSIPEKDKSLIDIGIQADMSDPKDRSDIGQLLNQLIAQKTRNIHVESSTNTEPIPSDPNQSEMRHTSDLLETLQKALSFDEEKVEEEKKTFKAKVFVNGALHLPGRKKCKARKSKNKSGKHEDILPSTYVTFESLPGELKMTPVVPKSISPKWNYSFDVLLPVEFLTNNQKRLIFKVWRKSTNTTMIPNLQTDFVIGIAALDLTVLLAGLSSLQGWFNILDFSNKCNGQINIHITPQENVSKYQTRNESKSCNSNHALEESFTEFNLPLEITDEPGELLGRALKRKFTELDEITQRLRLRLSKVTNEQQESDTSNDEFADEFERDINTLCVEDDFDMVDFEKEARNFNLNHMREVGLLQETDINRGTVEGKQKIDNLVEKLSLLSAENRHISGCSHVKDDNADAVTLLDNLDKMSRPNIHNSLSFDRSMGERFQWASNSATSCSESETSRSGPEGQQSEKETE